MTLYEHPIWQFILPYAHLDEGRENLDFLQMPDQLRALALKVVANCVACGAVINPLRARQKSERSRVGGTETERRLFYAPTCPTERNPGCSRTLAAKQHKVALLARIARAGEVETYDALCLKEPWLELILLGIKTLETRTKCLRRKAGEVVLTSSTIDEEAWDDPLVGGLLSVDDAARARAGLGKVRGLVRMEGFRPGVPEVEDSAACIQIAYEGGVRWVSQISNVRRLVERPVERVRPDGTLIAGSSQGFFRIPSSIAVLA